MASKLVEDIYKFNQDAGLLGKGMDSFKETAYILEEAVEGYEDVFNNPDDPNAPVITARGWAVSFLNQVKDAKEARNLPMPTRVEEVDKAIDGIVFNIGKLAKMGLSPDDIDTVMAIVNKANMAKLTGPKDELGKQLKPDGWVGPEAELEAFLDTIPEPELVVDTPKETNE